MIIEGKRIQNAQKYLGSYESGKKIVLAVPTSAIGATAFKRSGFSKDVRHGDAVLPSVVGPITRFNAEGAWNVRKDLPKEKRYIRTVSWRWTQWVGRSREEREEFRDIYKNCYQREFIDPPSENISFASTPKEGLIISREYEVHEGEYEKIKHGINLFLELFGVCHILDEGLKLAVLPKTRLVHWKLLPAGEYPWEILKGHIEEKIKSRAPTVTSVIWDRQKTIHSYEPSATAVGSGGFSDYVAYIFPEQEFVVLESVQKGNAIYVFEKNWEFFSRLTKAEILSNGFELERIIHTEGWKMRLAKLFKSRRKPKEAKRRKGTML